VVYSIQHYVIKFVCDLRQVGGIPRFLPPIKLTNTILNLTFKHENIVQIITLTGDNKIKTVYAGTVGVLLLMKTNMTLKMTQSVIHV
jgi:hypothetical protein